MRAFGLALGLALPLMGGASPFAYESVSVPAGTMTLELPLNTYLNTDYLSIPVRIERPFDIGRFEVTRRQWQACHLAGACAKAALPKDGAGPEHPMVEVNWHEARAFARWYAKASGQAWRLPTDHEWFYVASLGQGYKSEEKRYDYSDIEKIKETPKLTYPAGRFGANAWGVADMLGNVWEWTLSCHSLSPKKLLRPMDAAWLDDPERCMTRVTGGEHRAEVPDFVADTYQGGCSTLKPAANLGLRLVRER